MLLLPVKTLKHTKHTKLTMSETDKDLSSAYKLKKWGKDVDGVYIIDGYSYKGKKVFLKALKGFKDMFNKGFIGEMKNEKSKFLIQELMVPN